MILKQGDRGAPVARLQRQLLAAGYDAGAPDGVFGAKTAAAVLAFQVDRPDLEDDQVAGPATHAALEALELAPVVPPAKPAELVAADVATWDAFLLFVEAITNKPVRYGPGRGLWDGTNFLITYAPGRYTKPGDLKLWPNVAGKAFPSLHCTSFTNLFLAWLLRRNGDYTHAGNIPSLFELCKLGPELHAKRDAGVFRGYGNAVTPIAPDGSGARRAGVPGVVDMLELLERARAGTLPTFMVFGQSTVIGGKRKWWHHTGVLAARGTRLYRIAADGFKASQGYSADAMLFREVTAGNVARYAAAFYQVYGVDTLDGSYGDATRPIAAVDFEA